MSFVTARSTASDAASLARAKGNEELALLAEALAELARTLSKELRDIKSEVDTVRRRQN